MNALECECECCVRVCESTCSGTRSYNWQRCRCAQHEFFIDAQIFELCPSSQSETLALRARIRGYIQSKAETETENRETEEQRTETETEN